MLGEEDLFDYQKPALEYLKKHPKSLLNVKMGLGKTPLALLALSHHKASKILVICSKNAYNVWATEVPKWFGEHKVVLIEGKGSNAAAVRIQQWKSKGTFFVTTPSAFIRDILKLPNNFFQQFDAIVMDEAQRFIRNYKSKTYKAVEGKLKSSNPRCVFILSGSPAGRGSQDLWAFWHILWPRVFPSYWRYVYTYCEVSESMFGKEIGAPKNSGQLRRVAKEHGYVFIGNLKSSESKFRRQEFPVTLVKGSLQQKLISNIAKDMLAELSSGQILLTPNALTRDLRIRQALCCPSLLDPEIGVGQAFKSITEKVTTELPIPHVVIFTPFVKAIPFFVKYLKDKYGLASNYLHGGQPHEQVKEQIEEFNKRKTVMLCSIQFAQAFSLDSACYSFFVGADYDYWNNLQAEARLVRATTKHFVLHNYVVHKGNRVEKNLFEIAGTKARNMKLLYYDKTDLQNLQKS